MADRVELFEQDVENVTGGAFRYKEDENGNYLCKVDDIGVFFASDNAKRKLNAYYLNSGCTVTPQEIVDYGLENGYLWT